MNNDIQAPGCGIHENIPFDEYLKWPYVSNSSLQPAKRSMLHYRYSPAIEETPEMRLGTLCHLGRLEPSAVLRKYIVMPDLTTGITTAKGEPAAKPKATQEYERRVAAWESQHAADKTVVSNEEFEKMIGVVSALDSHPLCHQWFTSEGPTEVSIVWDDPETGIRCKGRLDKLSFQLGMILDLKTCRDCLLFPRIIFDRGYYRQGSFYIDGVIALTGEVLRFGLAAVEPDKPHGVMAAPLREEDVELGRQEYSSALRQVAESRAANRWPGYESPAEWAMPSWVHKSELSEPFELTISGEKVSL